MKKKVENFIWRAKDNKIISCDETNKVLNENLKISRDSSISIQTDGLFGSKFLVIEIGGEEDYL